MINSKIFIVTFLLSLNLAISVHATSLDELYRDIVREDNSGYLPLFVKNRTTPDFLLDDTTIKQIKEKTPLIPITGNNEIINFENKRKQKELEETLQQQQWQQTIETVKKGRVTAVELKEIEKRIQKNDTQALEIYAYIYAKGIGVKPNLIKAFKLYKRAEKLKVPNAKENAAKVYKAMSKQQRKELISQ